MTDHRRTGPERRQAGTPLNRAIAKAGLLSRSQAEAAVRAGRVSVNNGVTTDPFFRVDQAQDRIEVDGRLLDEPGVWLYYAFHKPKNVVTTTAAEPSAPKARIVADFFADLETRVFPCGRLDRESEGLLLVTSDPGFLDFVTDPAHEVEKEYVVTLSQRVLDDQLPEIAAGVTLPDGTRYSPRAVTRDLSSTGRPKLDRLRVVLTEGKNREIRKLFHHAGFKVTKLVRIRVGPVTLDGIEPGLRRPVTAEELATLGYQPKKAKKTKS